MSRDPSMRTIDTPTLRKRLYERQQLFANRLPGQAMRGVRTWLTRYQRALDIRGQK